MRSMSEFLILCKPRPRWQRDLVDDKGYSTTKRIEMYLALDEEERIKNMNDKILKQNNCDHKFVCIYRHPTSDLRCTKCDKIVTYTEYHQALSNIGKEDNTMISASEARKKIDEQLKSETSKQFEVLKERIETAIGMGRYEVYYIDDCISIENIKTLKKYGYNIHSDGRDGTFSYQISWAKE